MSTSLDRIEAILNEIEGLDAATKGQFRQVGDCEAFAVASRIERKMRRNIKPSAGCHIPQELREQWSMQQ